MRAAVGSLFAIVEWSDEDGCFVGSAPPLIGPCCHDKDEAKVYCSTLPDRRGVG